MRAYAHRLLFLFGLAYFLQGIGQDRGLVAQPIRFFFKETLGLDPAQTTEYLAVVAIPWVIKPLYGLVSDFVPLLGYRRKTWLLLVNALAATGLLWLAGLTAPATIVTALMLTAFGTAAADVIIDSLMVENGKLTGLTAQFQSVQWMSYNIAGIVSALLGGFLCTVSTPGTALHIAAIIALFAPITLMVASWLIVREQRTTVSLAEFKSTSASLWQSLKSRTLWAVLAVIALWNFSPGFGNPWYYHMTDTLNFSQGFIGTLGALENAGGIAGALVYWRVFSHMPLRRQLAIGIGAGTIGTLFYLFLVTPSAYSKVVAIGAGLAIGAAAMVSTLANLTLAARVCPVKSEGFTFAALMAVNNGVVQLSQIIGARLYTNVFDRSLAPLILVSAAFTLACYLVLPLLRNAEL